jgi:membrane protease YdiL (CAAX protease family)
MSLVFNVGISNFVYIFIFVGVAEEFGWRGYALDRLQTRFGAASSSVILGLIWGLWHLPLFFIPGSNQQAAGIVPYLLQIIVFSVWFTWMYNNSNRSILSVIVFHTMMDLTLLTIFPVISVFGPNSLPTLSLYISGIVILVFIIMFWGPKRLKRQADK